MRVEVKSVQWNNRTNRRRGDRVEGRGTQLNVDWCQSVLMQHSAMYTSEQKVFKTGKQKEAIPIYWPTGKPYILELLLLLQESQLLLPLLTNPRDKWIEKPELFTVFVHLEVGVLKHNFKSIVREDIREALQERQGSV